MNAQTPTDPPLDPITLALAALAATLDEPKRAQRFLDLTGIGIHDLRERAADPALLMALFDFLQGHEPDLLAVCEKLGLRADQLIAARRDLEGGRLE